MKTRMKTRTSVQEVLVCGFIGFLRRKQARFRLASGMDFTDFTVFLSKIRYDFGAIPTRNAQDVPRVFTRLYCGVCVFRVLHVAFYRY